MIQIIGLRQYTSKEGKQKTTHKLFLEEQNLQEVFKNIDKIIEKIPEHERWNLYYTALDCHPKEKYGGALRRFKSQKVIPFDIDNIDTTKLSEYINVFFQTTKFDDEKTAIVFTGNGLQLIVELNEPFKSTTYFNEHREHYKAICKRLDEAFKKEGLPSDTDPSVWSAARILRLPNTENRKEKKGIKQAKLLQPTLLPQDFSWGAVSKLEFIEDDQQLKDWDKTPHAKVDEKEIFNKCNFFKWIAEKPEEVREPAFYAALSIVTRMDGGTEKAYGIAEKIKDSGNDSSVASYSHSEIDQKIDQALNSSGPRTCTNINSVMGWAGKCKDCKLRGRVSSPIAIKGKDFIATQESGFYKISKQGKLLPQYDDLMRYFDSKYHFKTIGDNGEVSIWKDNYYQDFSRTRLDNFAEMNFKPSPQGRMVTEFRDKVKRNNLVDIDFYSKKTEGLTNLKNGILCLNKKELRPHSPDIGFRYILPYDYNPSAKCPNFKKFLKQVTCGDESLQMILQEYMGYIVSGDEYWLHKCLMLTGTGSNGKGVFTRLLAAMVGEDNHSSVMFKEMVDEKKRQMLDGKLFNLSDEIGAKELKDTALFKMMTGNGKLTVRELWKGAYSMANRAKLVFNSNELPVSDDDSKGFKRRMCIVPFNREFVEGKDDDPLIFEKLVEELPGILNFAIEGYDRLKINRKFTESNASKYELDEYTISNDSVRWWYEETKPLIVKPLNGRCTFVPNEKIYEMYSDYMIGKGRGNNLPPNAFSKKIGSIIPDGRGRRGKKITDGIERRGFYDVTVREDVNI